MDFSGLLKYFVPKEKKDGVIYGNYHQMVRSEIMPARVRNTREKGEALVPIVVEKSEVVATSKPTGGVTVIPFDAVRFVAETLKLVFPEAVP